MFRIEILRCTLSRSHPQRFSRASFLLSTWYSPESISAADNDDDPVLVKLSVAIRDSYKDPPLEFSSFTYCPSIRKVLPSLSVHHVVDLINHNPLSLPHCSIFAFFKFISSQPGFRFTVETYFVMARFLAVHEMFTEAQSLIELVVSRKGKNSASSVFISLVEMRGTPMCGFLVDALMITYTDLGFIPDAIQCFRLSRKHRFDVPIRGCGNLLDRMMKLNPTGTIWGFYMEILDAGFPLNVYVFNILMNKFCKEGNISDAQKVFDEITKRSLQPTVIRKEMDQNGIELDRVGFSALICGMCKEGRVIDAERALREMMRAGMKPDDVTYTMMMDAFCKKGDAQTGFKLLKEMQSDGHVPSVVTYNVLLNGLCKLGQMKNADMLLDAMLNIGVVPDDITYNTLLEGHHRHANASKHYKQKPEIGIVADLASYKSIVNELYRASKDHRNR
ncbi:unnamed protein product [Arabidopsis thaliana]|uniref:(thale cress) hypothetical protein n=1 Tax=Arabidopsis thaliana TaxID=3702 RepID=A0A7G2DPL6_ARATH|nr:unnamed protein product [Arabidopsis thaliana]